MSGDRRKQEIVDTFSTVASGYDTPALRLFPFCADKLIALLQPAPGKKLLDVATGTGAVAIAAAQMIGPDGRVTAIDFSEAMLDKAQKNIAKMALDNIDLHVMDGSALEFRGNYFDYVSCSFGLFFMEDMAQALQQWKRVCRPGGSIGFTSFGDEAFTPLMTLFRQLAEKYGVGENNQQKPYGLELLKSPDRCLLLLEEAGFGQCRVHTEQMGYHLKNAEEWWEVLWNSGARAVIMKLPQQQLGKFKREHLAEIETLQSDDGIYLNIQTHFSFAVKEVLN